MSRAGGVLLLLGCIGLARLQAQAGQVLVPNAGMEQGAEGPANWSWGTGEEGEGEFSVETRWAHSGDRSFRIKRLGPQGYTDLVGDPISVQPNHSYEVTAWVYPLRNVRRGVYFMINQLPAGPQHLRPDERTPRRRRVAAGESPRGDPRRQRPHPDPLHPGVRAVGDLLG